MKVALVHSFYSEASPSGENIVVDAQRQALERNGFDVEVIAVHTDALAKSRGYTARTALNVATGRGYSPLDRLTKIAPDIVHVHNLFPNFGTAWLDSWVGPIVATLHNYRPSCAAGTLYRDGEFCRLCPDRGSHNAVVHACYRDSRLASIPLAIRNRRGATGDALIQRADRLIVLSSRAQAVYRSLGVPEEKLELIPNFVNDDAFDPQHPSGDHWVYLGRLSTEKGVRNLLTHWPADQELRLYGDGPLRDEVAKSALGHMRYMGPIAHSAVPGVLASARGLVVSSEWAEGAVPLTHVEALAAGRPTLAKSGNGAADDIIASGAGWVFDDWGQLSAAICRNQSILSEHSKRARLRFESHYSVDNWLSSTTAVYSALTEGR